MTIQQIYDLALKMGLKADPRGEAGVKKYLAKIKKQYEALPAGEKKYFDQSKLVDPYADSSIHLVDKPGAEVRGALVGVDIGVGELLLAEELRDRGEKIDLVLAHHPLGRPLAELPEVMDLQVDSFAAQGVPVHIAETLMQERVGEVGRSVHPANHYREIDAGRLLGFNLMNTHTLTDNLVQKFLVDYLKKKKPETVGEAVEALLELPEYQEAKRRGSGPQIINGRAGNRAGKIYVDMTGGTNPSEKIYQELSKAGVSTVVGMHLNEKSFEQAKGAFLNIVIAGHLASDSLGMNLFLDELEKRGIKIIPCSGLIRVSRAKK
ncbi:MAG: NGG1p interacting factor NIF3 [Candidatus Magasanikbacteria bacterium]|nr:NGG1p interacting factor NIF3 [Candidatus Magasanikbacteria bacterium]